MRLEIVIRVSEEKVVVEVPERGWMKEYTNLIAIHQGKKLIVDLGQPLEKMQKENLERWGEEAEQIKYLPIYDPNDFDPEITGNGLRYFKFQAFRESQSKLRQFFTQSNLSLWLPGNYLDSVGDIHQHFEYQLQKNLGLNSLEINGVPVSWPVWQRKLVQFYSIIPIIFTFFAFLWLLPVMYPINRTWISTIFNQMAEPWNTIGTVLNFLSTFVLLGLLGGGIAVLLLGIYRFLVPKTLFLLHQASIPLRGGFGEKWLIWLAERLLVDDPIFSPKTS